VSCYVCPDAKYRVSCNYVNEGTCEETPLFSREPLCPVELQTLGTLRQGVGTMQDLGGFRFEDVFGVESRYADFA
jgi:hypothetical protein